MLFILIIKDAPTRVIQTEFMGILQFAGMLFAVMFYFMYAGFLLFG